MTLESRDTLCDANPPIFRRRPNYRPFRCLEEKDRANQAGDSSAMKLGVWPLEEVRRLGHETRIASKGAKMASFPDLYSTAFEKVPLSAPLCTQSLPHLARGATRWLSASQVLSSLFILCLSSRRSPTQGTRTKKGKRGGGGRGRPSFSFCRQGQMAWNLKELDRGGGVASSSQKGDGHPNPGQIRVGQHRITSPLADEDSTSNR